jgi:hypothetical protein
LSFRQPPGIDRARLDFEDHHTGPHRLTAGYVAGGVKFTDSTGSAGDSLGPGLDLAKGFDAVRDRRRSSTDTFTG